MGAAALGAFEAAFPLERWLVGCLGHLRETWDRKERRERWQSDFLATRDASGRVVDFHALRHSFLTRLARSGVAPAVAKSLARHSTITLTMDHYTHTFIEDERSALARLPGLGANATAEERVRATGTGGVSPRRLQVGQG